MDDHVPGRHAHAGRQARQVQDGGARFAIETGAPVVPIAHNAGRVWPRNSFTKFPGVVTVSIGKPIASEGLTPDALNSQVEAWIEAEMRRIDPDSYRQAAMRARAMPRVSDAPRLQPLRTTKEAN